MKRTLLGLFALALLAFGFLMYKFQSEIAAKIWHLRFGQITYVHDYSVPVPENWRAMAPNQDTVILVNGTLKNELGPSTIMIMFVSHFSGDVGAWNNATRRSLNRRGLQTVEEKQIQSPDQSIECLGGRVFRDVVHMPNANAFTMECMSVNKLSIVFIGEHLELPEFYNIVSQIHKR